MNLVDKYVIYDDVNFIKGGWINRNKVLMNGEGKYFNLPMKGASPNKKINEIMVNNDNILINKNLRFIESCYRRAPYYDEVFPMIKRILQCNEPNLASFIKYSFEEICKYLSINTDFIVSSKMEKDNSLHAQDKVIHICKLLDADEYYNAIGGQSLYSYQDFKENGIDLKFVKTNEIIYKQFNNSFVPNLSIIDILMFNSVDEIKKMLNNFKIVSEKSKGKIYERKK